MQALTYKIISVCFLMNEISSVGFTDGAVYLCARYGSSYPRVDGMTYNVLIMSSITDGRQNGYLKTFIVDIVRWSFEKITVCKWVSYVMYNSTYKTWKWLLLLFKTDSLTSNFFFFFAL